MGSRTRRLPLRGADLVLLAMHGLHAGTKVGRNTILVVQCDGAIAPDRIRRALDRLLEFCPWPASRLRREFPWGELHWAAGPRTALEPPPVRQLFVSSPAELHGALEAELNSLIDPRREPPLRFLAVDGGPGFPGGRGFLVLTWFHPLMDPRGGQNLLMNLVKLDREGERAPDLGVRLPSVPARDSRPFRERARLGRLSLDYMRTLTRVPPVSPGTGQTGFGNARFWHGTFMDRPATDGRGTRDICWRLAAVGKAMSVLWEKRRLPDVPYLVPISVDLRPKGNTGPAIGNWLAFHFARFKPSETADVVGLARSLRLQMADAMRGGQIDANAVAMEFLRYRPLWMMPRFLPGGADGETFSFNCADIKDFPPALETVFDNRVVNAYHAPAILPRPGIGVFFNRCGMRNNLVVSWVEGAASEDDVAQIAEVVRRGMAWAETA